MSAQHCGTCLPKNSTLFATDSKRKLEWCWTTKGLLATQASQHHSTLLDTTLYDVERGGETNSALFFTPEKKKWNQHDSVG